MPVTVLFASESSQSAFALSPLSLLLILILVAVVGRVLYVVIRRGNRPKSAPIVGFPVVSLLLLGVSLVLFIAGTIIGVVGNDAIGSAIAAIGGFIGTYEVRRRHKLEGHPDEPLLVRKNSSKTRMPS